MNIVCNVHKYVPHVPTQVSVLRNAYNFKNNNMSKKKRKFKE